MTRKERLVLWTLRDAGPQFNGSLGAMCGLEWNSCVFDRLERDGLIEGHPYTITNAGRASLKQQPITALT